MSSDLLAKCLPCILCAIQSSLGLASAYWRVKFHMFMELRGILKKEKNQQEKCQIITDVETQKEILTMFAGEYSEEVQRLWTMTSTYGKG